MEHVLSQRGTYEPRLFILLLVLIAWTGLHSTASAQVVVYRVNAGGPTTEAGDVTYPDWAEDQQDADDPPPIQFARNGTPSPYVNYLVAGDQTAGRNKEHDLAGILDPSAIEALFTTQRWDPTPPDENMVWSFPVSVEHEYKVVLYFSELFGEGQNTREFDILIEGELVDAAFDVLEETGNLEKVGVVREYEVFAGDESLDIEFQAVKDLPAMISAIEIIDISTGNQKPDIADAGAQFNREGDEVSLLIEASDPDEGQGISFEAENLPAGLSIDAKGFISGVIDEGAGGIYDVRVIVVDTGIPSAGTIMHFTWDVAAGDPVVDNPMQDLDRLIGDPDDDIDLSAVFSDPAGLALTFSVEGNTDPGVVSANVEGNILTLSYLATGTSEITVQAKNTLGLIVSDAFSVTVQGGGFAEALVQVTPTRDLGGSTFDGGSMVIKNNSTEGVRIQSVTFDLSSSLFPDMVFDPVGTAGDSGSKCLTANSGAPETGFVTPANLCVDPFSDASEGGFNIMTMNFDDFDAGETFTFSVDVDPTSIKGNLNVGNAGSVGGVELMGSQVIVTFSNEVSVTNDLIYVPGSQGGSETIAKLTPPDAPSIALEGVEGTTATVSDPNQNIIVTGPPGADVWIVQLDGRLNLLGVPDGGFDIEPFEANEAIGNTWEYFGVVEGDGDVAVPVTMRMSIKDGNGSGGLNHFIAVVVDEIAGRTSNKLVVELLAESTVNVAAGWNMVGLSYDVDDNNYASLYGAASPTGAPYGWSGLGYEQTETLTPGAGYWLDAASAADVTIIGSDIPAVTADVTAGWNMISGPSCIFDMVKVQDDAGIIVPNTLYRFEGAYVLSDAMTPNVGYWIEVTADGTLGLDCTTVVVGAPSKRNAPREAAHASFGVLRASTDAMRSTDLYFGSELADESAGRSYGMPPLARRGLDVRFNDESRLLEGNEGILRLSSDEFPVRLEMVRGPEGSIEQFYLDALVDGAVVNSYALYEGESVTITNEKVTALKLRTEAFALESVPESFALRGNYPNPFNPTTNFVFDLPEDATMQVSVYDLLGRRVMEIGAVEMAAGAGRQLQVDASSLASGTYVYRVQATMASGQFVQSGRMTLLK